VEKGERDKAEVKASAKNGAEQRLILTERPRVGSDQESNKHRLRGGRSYHVKEILLFSKMKKRKRAPISNWGD